jgi:hypothetical protein
MNKSEFSDLIALELLKRRVEFLKNLIIEMEE